MAQEVIVVKSFIEHDKLVAATCQIDIDFRRVYDSMSVKSAHTYLLWTVFIATRFAGKPLTMWEQPCKLKVNRKFYVERIVIKINL